MAVASVVAVGDIMSGRAAVGWWQEWKLGIPMSSDQLIVDLYCATSAMIAAIYSNWVV